MKHVSKRLRTWALAAFVTSPLLLADDTDIYYSAFAGESRPMVMIGLDVRSNLANTQCADVFEDSCRTSLSDALYLNLDLISHDPDDSTVITFGPDGEPDANFYVADLESPTSEEVAALQDAWRAAIAQDGSYMDEKVRLFDLLRAAFHFIINNDRVQQSGLRLGLMVSHEDSNCAGPSDIPNGNSGGCSNGAYVLKGFFDITDETELTDFYRRLAALPTPTYTPIAQVGQWNGHTYQLNELYFEFYRYITGQDMYNGWLGYEDYNSNDDSANITVETENNDAPYADWDRDQYVAPDIATYSGTGSSANYNSPFENGSPDDWECSGLYMINTIFGTVQDDAESNDAIAAAAPAGLALDFGNSTTNAEREDLIRKLRDTDLAGYTDPNDPSSTLIGVDITGDQGLTSFVLSDTTNNSQDGWAEAGGTDYALSLGDGAEIKAQLEAVFESIISESSTLVSASVPVNVFNRAESVDNVFLAIFQAESGSRWPGNIKKLKLGVRTVDIVDPNDPTTVIGTAEAPVVQDASSPPEFAFDQIDGRIKHSALTYWTDPVGEDVTPSNCIDGDDPLTVDEKCGKDGRSVTRGGAGQQIAGFNTNGACYGTGPGEINTASACTRNLYTENPDSPLALIDFNADDTTAALLATLFDPDNPDADESLKLIKWARGAIELNGSLAEQAGAPQRWMLGDVLHGRPLPVNYGDTDGDDDPDSGYGRSNPDIRLLFGSNDGWLRMVKNTNSDGSESGDEVWGFMPLEVMGIQKDLARDILPSTGHPYGVDGDITALIVDRDSDGNIENGANNGDFDHSGDKVFVFVGLRRGGNAYYAFDISDPDSEPYLMWKITNTGDYAELGMTFSAPRVAIINYEGDRVPAVVFAGGYNGGWNADGTRIGKDVAGVRTVDTVGNAIYVADALTGDLIWKTRENTAATNVYVQSDMDYSIPSDITILDSDQNGVTDMGYVGDTGGNIWRIDLPESPGRNENGDPVDVRDTWKTTRLGTFGGTGVNDRRFFHAPDIVLATDLVTDNGVSSRRDYVGILINSGDRAYPQEAADATVPENYMYYIKDPLTVAGSATSDRSSVFHHNYNDGNGGLEDITDICETDAECNGRDLTNGWQLALADGGEKGLATPITIQGVAYFTTYLPEAGTAEECGSGLGGGRLYAVNIADGSPAYNLSGQGGDALIEADRYTDLDTPGIPAGLPPVTLNGKFSLLEPDGDVRDIEGRFKWKIYWSERGVDAL